MRPPKSLPMSPEWTDEESYVESLLHFVTSDTLFQNLCGGVHILDFLTRKPDLYSTLFPTEWRSWFALFEVSDILDLLLREDLAQFAELQMDQQASRGHVDGFPRIPSDGSNSWRGTRRPPESLIRYIYDVRRHSLDRRVKSASCIDNSEDTRLELARQVSVGMKPKKIHEVTNCVRYLDNLKAYVDSNFSAKISHVVDFGSGQSYLGRALASPPYCADVVAIESKQHNIDGARSMDVSAKLRKKELVMRNKKAFRAGNCEAPEGLLPLARSTKAVETNKDPSAILTKENSRDDRSGSIEYFEKSLETGDLSALALQLKRPPNTVKRSDRAQNEQEPRLMVVSLHSCGNLVHHGLRSITLNASVKAVAMVGCCYNLMTERLGPSTSKLPNLRNPNKRMSKATDAYDPHGYPISERVATYKHLHGEGVRLNITARMMAVQAPANWTMQDSEGFFTRHFFRALLQRIFVDHGILGQPGVGTEHTEAASPRGWSGAGQSIILGSLRKSCYTSFRNYVRGAIEKLRKDPIYGTSISRLEEQLDDDDVDRYANQYTEKKKELSILWSFMAFSASAVESLIAVDRWLYLREQPTIADCWVEAVFEYAQSPRNLAVVGIKG